MTTEKERLKREARETAELKRQALDLGIDITRNNDWWWDDSEDFVGSVREDQLEYATTYYLTEQGKAGYRRHIREELARLKDRRIRWWCEIIAAVTGLAGAIIGILAIILAMLRK